MPSLPTAIVFLTKRDGKDKTDEDDHKKLARVAKNMRRTKFIHLISEAKYLDQNQ